MLSAKISNCFMDQTDKKLATSRSSHGNIILPGYQLLVEKPPSSPVPEAGIGLYINKFFPFVLICFYLNNIGLPHGLLYTTVLAPIFYFWLLSEGERLVLSKFFIVMFPFALAHLMTVDTLDMYFYCRSFILLMLVYISVYAAFILFKRVQLPRRLFEQIILINFFLVCVAILIKDSPGSEMLWYSTSITQGSGIIQRLRMFSYEAAHYSMLLVPLFVFSLVSYVVAKTGWNVLLLLLTLTPLALSFSMGILSALALAIAVVGVCNARSLVRSPPAMFVGVLLIGTLLAILLTDNLLSMRIYNVIEGADSSGNVRTWQSLDIGYQLAKSTNLFWGSGFGQAKLLAPDLFEQYWPGFNITRIPNVIAATMAELGLAGVLLRLGLECFLFFYTRVYSSHFRLILFLFAFVYQFTGSYPTNLTEYIIWILAFCPLFPEFEKRMIPSGIRRRPRWLLSLNERVSTRTDD
ncbi:MAG: hypothetical protein ACE5DY_07490 [Mariprofundaceae bacterium]